MVNENICRYLIENGVELDTGPEPALHLALRKKYCAIALLLLQAGAEFESKDNVSHKSSDDLIIHH